MTNNYKIMKDKFFAYISSISLADGIDRDHTYLGHSYGRNALLLGWPHGAFADAIDVIHEMNSLISKKTIGQLLGKSMVELFHHFNCMSSKHLRQ